MVNHHVKDGVSQALVLYYAHLAPDRCEPRSEEKAELLCSIGDEAPEQAIPFTTQRISAPAAVRHSALERSVLVSLRLPCQDAPPTTRPITRRNYAESSPTSRYGLKAGCISRRTSRPNRTASFRARTSSRAIAEGESS